MSARTLGLSALIFASLGLACLAVGCGGSAEEREQERRGGEPEDARAPRDGLRDEISLT